MNKKHLLILGPQGSGKSHLLNIIKRLANPIQWVVLEAYTLPQKTKELRMNLAHGAFLIIEEVNRYRGNIYIPTRLSALLPRKAGTIRSIIPPNTEI
jgi:energy-coupling factor transporter ATP-binding protein EcfA2